MSLPPPPLDASTPLVEELAPPPDPWRTAQCLAGLPHLLFLDSADRDSPLARYSFVTARPYAVLRARGPGRDPFRLVGERLAPYRMQTLSGLPPFQGGAAGLFGYGLAHHVERLPRPRFDEFALPDLVVGLYDWVISFDHTANRAWLIATGLPETDPSRRLRRAATTLRAVRGWLAGESLTDARSESPPPLALEDLCPMSSLPQLSGLRSNFDCPAYLAAVQRAIDYVHAGDCFQVNIAQRLLVPADLPPLDLYGRLRERNPAPFAGFFDLGDGATVASASPERLLRVTDGQVETRPIKGTRPRGTTPEEDDLRRRELLASAKDRAENVMIVDLMRNDLGRACRYGSIHVPALCRLETYRTVHHLVSEVRGVLRPGVGPLDLLRSAFPGGSVTGAPKVRAMEIIAELEPTVRGPYCGSLGYVGFDGSMDTSLLIRTCTHARGWVQFPVGGGIVADSTPRQEYEETLHKAEGILRALRSPSGPRA